MSENVLLVRFPPNNSESISLNPHLQDFNFHVIAQHPAEAYSGRGRFASAGRDFPHHNHPELVDQRIRTLIKKYKIERVVATQKLYWYSNVVEYVCRDLQIPLLWSEAFFDGKMVFDRSGLQYTRRNDLKFDKLFEFDCVSGPKCTRESQPNSRSPESIWNQYGKRCVPVFGQCPGDMALVDHYGTNYRDWLTKLFIANPDTNFLFKHHPRLNTPLPKFNNVLEINLNILDLFKSYDHFASFSSTTIYEGLVLGKKFMTGGRHFCSGLTVWDRLECLSDFEPDNEKMNRRLGFIDRIYAIPLDGEVLRHRITMETSEEFMEMMRKNMV